MHGFSAQAATPWLGESVTRDRQRPITWTSRVRELRMLRWIAALGPVALLIFYETIYESVRDNQWHPFRFTWVDVGEGALLGGFVFAIFTLILRRLEDLHAQTEATLQEGARLRATIDERQRLAGEIHDVHAQTLSAILFGLDRVAGLMLSQKLSEARAEVEHLHVTCDRAYSAAREMLVELHDDLGQQQLSAVITRLTTEFTEASGVGCVLDVDQAADVPPQILVQVTRVVSESLRNIRDHAGAKRVVVKLRREQSRVVISIADDGKGFDQNALMTKGHFGISIMRERIESIGGELKISSLPGSGTTVVISVPGDEPDSKE